MIGAKEGRVRQESVYRDNYKLLVVLTEFRERLILQQSAAVSSHRLGYLETVGGVNVTK